MNKKCKNYLKEVRNENNQKRQICDLDTKQPISELIK